MRRDGQRVSVQSKVISGITVIIEAEHRPIADDLIAAPHEVAGIYHSIKINKGDLCGKYPSGCGGSRL